MQITIKTSTEEIQYETDIIIKHNYDDAEYILPCTVNVLSEDDIIIDFVISGISVYVSMVYLFMT